MLADCIMLHVLILPCSLQLCMTSWFFLEHLNCDLLNFRVQEERKQSHKLIKKIKIKNIPKEQTLRTICPAVVMFSLSFCVFVARQDCEALETETKRFEDLEFQQLERESRQDDEKETHAQQLLRDIADYQRSTVTRKVRVEVERFSNGGCRRDPPFEKLSPFEKLFLLGCGFVGHFSYRDLKMHIFIEKMLGIDFDQTQFYSIISIIHLLGIIESGLVFFIFCAINLGLTQLRTTVLGSFSISE